MYVGELRRAGLWMCCVVPPFRSKPLRKSGGWVESQIYNYRYEGTTYIFNGRKMDDQSQVRKNWFFTVLRVGVGGNGRDTLILQMG